MILVTILDLALAALLVAYAERGEVAVIAC
jgi:hypothetical protein